MTKSWDNRAIRSKTETMDWPTVSERFTLSKLLHPVYYAALKKCPVFS
jgi:hypothetical protein